MNPTREHIIEAVKMAYKKFCGPYNVEETIHDCIAYEIEKLLEEKEVPEWENDIDNQDKYFLLYDDGEIEKVKKWFREKLKEFSEEIKTNMRYNYHPQADITSPVNNVMKKWGIHD